MHDVLLADLGHNIVITFLIKNARYARKRQMVYANSRLQTSLSCVFHKLK